MMLQTLSPLTKTILNAVFLLFIGFPAFSQKHKSHFIGIQTDNDAYLMTGQDRYYTNGLILTYSKPLHVKEESSDLFTFQFGHQLFNGKSLYNHPDFNWDRPSTGRFFANAVFQRLYQNEWLWNVKTEIGIVGDAGKGKEIQRFIHNVFGMYEVESWEAELKSAVGLDVEAKVLKSFWRSASNRLELSAVGGARVGMNFANLSAQVAFRAGKLAHYRRSNFVGNGGFFSDEAEYYFFYMPGYRYQFYNASIQGSLFARKEDERYHILPNLFTQKVGFAYSKGKFTIEAAVLFNTREGREVQKNHQYGSIKGGIRF